MDDGTHVERMSFPDPLHPPPSLDIYTQQYVDCFVNKNGNGSNVCWHFYIKQNYISVAVT